MKYLQNRLSINVYEINKKYRHYISYVIFKFAGDYKVHI